MTGKTVKWLETLKRGNNIRLGISVIKCPPGICSWFTIVPNTNDLHYRNALNASLGSSADDSRIWQFLNTIHSLQHLQTTLD